MLKLFQTALKRAGIDGAVAFTLLSRVVQALGALGSVVFIGLFLSADELGYFYTFASILAIQIFFELGLSGIITQYTAHEFAHLHWTDTGLEGDIYNTSRLSSLLRLFVKWFGVLSVVLLFLLLAAGFYFFKNYQSSGNIEWQMPWVLLCFSTSLNLFVDPILAFIDGLGEVKDMARVRLVQKSANVLLLFLFFALGFKLYAGALASLLAILINYYQLFFTSRKSKLITIWKQQGSDRIHYLKEIFPFQWRIALSWVGAFFIFQLFNPVLFAFEGPKVAGQMGMSLQILNGVSGLSMGWMTTKVPAMSALIAKRDFKGLDNVFNRTLKSVMVVSLAIISIFYGGYLILDYLRVPLVYRFLPSATLAVMCVVTLGNQLIFSWAIYLRCHKQEPLLMNSVVVGVLCGISTIWLGRTAGVMGVVGGYAVISLLISLPWTFYVFITKRKEWHS